jgi:NAD(P)-dependent dehydrogenase (short-subunit alcohol dehydrogenase family)
MSQQKKREVALVTGVGRREGIGFEVCRQLARKNITVLLTARKMESANSLAAVLSAEGLDVRPMALDVSQALSIKVVAAEVESMFGSLDILINNAAGVGPYGERADVADLEIAEQVLDTTLFGAWRLSQAMLPLLRKSANGRLVNVSSGAGSHGDAVFGLTTNNSMGTSYAIAKAALSALTARMAHEEASPGVRINAVCPGFTATFPGGEAMGARPVAEGAAGIVWAALLAPDGPTGGFFRDGKALPW